MRTLRWLIVPLVLLPVVWLFVSGFGRDPRALTSPLIGRPAPTWSLATLDGGTLTSEDLAGTPYVVNFWASWCIPACVDEHPVLADAYTANDGDLVIVGVLYGDDPASASAFLERYGDAGYPHVIDPGGRLAIDFGVTGPPESFFVDAEGVVRAKQFGPLNAELMEARLATVLPAPRP